MVGGSVKLSVEIGSAIDQAMAFYSSIGKKPIRLRKEIPGHVANRLQTALYKEILYLIEQDVLDVADADDAVSWGPGLRWGIMGPNLQFHLAGGAAGIKHFLEGVFVGLSPLMNALGNPKITPELNKRSSMEFWKKPATAQSSNSRRKKTKCCSNLVYARKPIAKFRLCTELT
jgi:3-hydroxyacyl-CoA dehydrogenase